ncbi:unnamed protein product [Ambrosiozyma monospora]|uniref:Unnamed protein product n=1 Tax=Ambrosiozyma monospora TaxID=43982 RepID=A0ACB5TCR4_AMBMO|nr:unnamed protein product [Ambrosiozyma monospora]
MPPPRTGQPQSRQRLQQQKQKQAHRTSLRAQPARQQARPVSVIDPKIRAAELYKKANAPGASNTHLEHIGTGADGLRKKSSFERLVPEGVPQQSHNSGNNRASKRMTLRDSILGSYGDPAANGKGKNSLASPLSPNSVQTFSSPSSTPNNRRVSANGGVFKSRFSDSDSDLNVPVSAGAAPGILGNPFSPSSLPNPTRSASGFGGVNGVGEAPLRSVSAGHDGGPGTTTSSGAVVSPPPPPGGQRFFSEQIKPVHGDRPILADGDGKKKKFGKLRKLFGSSNKK